LIEFLYSTNKQPAVNEAVYLWIKLMTLSGNDVNVVSTAIFNFLNIF